FVSFLSEDFDHVAIGESVAERNHRAVDLGAAALMTDFSVNGVGKIHGSGAARENDDAAFGREGVNLFRVEVHAQGGEKFAGFLHLLDPLNQLAHPDDALVVGVGDVGAVFIFPVSGDALFGDAVHFLSANLNFEGLAGVDDGGVERLVEVGAGHGDV